MANHDNLDEGDVITPNRTADESFTKKAVSESGRASNQLRELTKKLTDFEDRNAEEPVTSEETSQLAYAAFLADLPTKEKIFDTSEDERKALYKRMTPGLAGLMRVLITADQPTMMPEPAKPQFP